MKTLDWAVVKTVFGRSPVWGTWCIPRLNQTTLSEMRAGFSTMFFIYVFFAMRRYEGGREGGREGDTTYISS